MNARAILLIICVFLGLFTFEVKLEKEYNHVTNITKGNDQSKISFGLVTYLEISGEESDATFKFKVT